MQVEQLIYLGYNIQIEHSEDDLLIELSHDNIDNVISASIPLVDYKEQGTPALHRLLKDMYNEIVS